MPLTHRCNVVFFQELLYSSGPEILRHRLIQRGSSLHNMYITLHNISKLIQNDEKNELDYSQLNKFRESKNSKQNSKASKQ